MPQATLKDVARRAGVSVNTVSRVLNSKPDVGSETRARVAQVVAELGYVPDGVARGLRRKVSSTIGVIVTDIGNPFFSAMVKGIEEETRLAGFQMILMNTDEDLALERDAVSVLLQKRVDGVLMTPCQKSDEPVRMLVQRHIPLVLMARRFDSIPTDFVVNDDALGGFLATEYLIAKGHRRILFLNGPPEIWSAHQRLAGYRNALARYAIPESQELTVSTTAKMEGAYQAIKDLLSRGVDFTAVYAFSDLLAMGVVRALREAGRKVPGDVAVVGHDDIEFADLLETPLTTVDMSKTRLGRQAAQILLSRLKGEEGDPSAKGVVLAPRLVVRSSA